MLVKYLYGTICINSCLSQGDLFIHIHEMPFSLTNLKGYSAGGECNTYLKEKERAKLFVEPLFEILSRNRDMGKWNSSASAS